jgi:hypothetical protein
MLGSEIVIVGGYLADGTSTGRVDAFTPRTGRWRRLPDLPAKVNHAMAAAAGGRLYVVGGYGAERRAFVFARGHWRALRRPPAPRAAAGAAIVGSRLYVAGGVTAPGALAKKLLVLDLRTGRWAFEPGPSPREHLAVVAAGGLVYALAGRSAGTNFTTVEAFSPARATWRRLPPVRVPATQRRPGRVAASACRATASTAWSPARTRRPRRSCRRPPPRRPRRCACRRPPRRCRHAGTAHLRDRGRPAARPPRQLGERVPAAAVASRSISSAACSSASASNRNGLALGIACTGASRSPEPPTALRA